MKRSLTIFLLIPCICLLADIYPYTHPFAVACLADFTFAYCLAAVVLMKDGPAFLFIAVYGFCLDALSGVPVSLISLFVFRYVFRATQTMFYTPYSVPHIALLAMLFALYRAGVFVVWQRAGVVTDAPWALLGYNVAMDVSLFLVFLYYLGRPAPRRRRR
jgi:hypothetical protein